MSLDKINFCECEDCYVILGLIIYMFCIERVSIVFIVFVIIILYGISYFLYIVEWGFVFIRFINFYGIFVCWFYIYIFIYINIFVMFVWR